MGKSSLSDCLVQVRQEAERQLTGLGPDAARDPLTGLKSRPAAEAALVAACASKSAVSAAVVTVDRVPLYNRRYGRDVGDKVLHFFAEYVKRCFAPESALYRWTGPVILILIPGPLEKGQAQVRAGLENRLQYECEAGSRTILLAVDASWSVFPMMVDPRLLINKIDAFVS
jgi:GGDEF domain-containing protein